MGIWTFSVDAASFALLGRGAICSNNCRLFRTLSRVYFISAVAAASAKQNGGVHSALSSHNANRKTNVVCAGVVVVYGE